jgi:hypothetical protein
LKSSKGHREDDMMFELGRDYALYAELLKREAKLFIQEAIWRSVQENPQIPLIAKVY